MFNKTVFTGSGVALVTPFNKDLSINYGMLSRLINWHIENKTDAIIICGTTGESATLSLDEKHRLYEFAGKAIGGRVPFIAGTGTNSTADAISLTKSAQESGADAVLMVTPYYNKTTQEGIFSHYEMIANATDVPIIIYNVPSRTGLNIKPKTYEKMCQIENIVGVKEANGDVSALVESMALCGERFDFYSGCDDQIVPFMSLGGKGVISVLANVCPAETHEICRLCLSNEFANAAKLQLQLSQLVKMLFCEVNPLPVKYAMNLMGIDVGATRPPLFELTDESKGCIKSALEKLNLV